jgi:NitT/TauT family transport system substrate-binding protein
VLLTAAMLAGCAALTACGNDDEAPASGASTDSAATGKCDGESVTYQLGFIPNPQHAGFLLAYERGYFEEEGVDLSMKPGGPTVSTGLQLGQGAADMADINLTEALNAAAKGVPLKLVAQTAQQNPLRYISLKKVPLATPADLVGPRVEVHPGEADPELKGMLATENLTLDDIETVKGSFDAEQFVSGGSDVFPLRIYGHIPWLEEAGYKWPDDFNILDPNKYGVGVAEYGVYANSEFLSESPEAVTCTLRAIKRGWEDAKADPAAAKAAVMEVAPKGAFTKADVSRNVDIVLGSYTSQDPEGTDVEPLTLNVKYLEDSAATLKKYGAVEGEVEMDEIIAPESLEAAGGTVIK